MNNPKLVYAHSQDSDQTAQMRRLIRILAFSMNRSTGTFLNVAAYLRKMDTLSREITVKVVFLPSKKESFNRKNFL